MKHLIRGLAIASVFALSSAAAVDVDVNEDDSSNLQRHKRNLIANSKKKNRISLNKRIRYNKKKKNDYNNVEDDDNTLFLTRLLQGSIPFTSAPTPLPVTPAPVPVPTDRPTTTSPTPIPVAPTLPPVVLVCGDLTPTERRDEILRILSTVSEPGSIETAGSPQQNAFDWIVDEDFTLKILCPYFTLLFHHNLGSPTFSLYFISLFHHILP